MGKEKASRPEVVLAVDQGTSATKTLIMDSAGSILSRARTSLAAQHPHPGWVEQDPMELKASVLNSMADAVPDSDISILGIGLSTQRESVMIWDRNSGHPLGPVLGWQDRRTVSTAAELVHAGAGEMVRAKSGLPIDPMFSALKLRWLLDDVDPDRRLSHAGKIAAGTVDSWIVHCLTGEHRIEVGNASRTQLMNLFNQEWDRDLLELFKIPLQVLPEIRPSTSPTGLLLSGPAVGARIHAVMGDSHSALYAHGVRSAGAVKATYGTGSSIMGLLQSPTATKETPGLVRTIAWQDGAVQHAFEANILATGATALWLAEVLEVDVAHLDNLARSVPDNGGVSIVPAFEGLGAPWWDERAQALITGFNLGTTRAHLARAAFESIALQIEDALAAAENHLGSSLRRIFVDGGPTSNAWLMQLQADLSQRSIVPGAVPDLSALGVAQMAATAVGLNASPKGGTESTPIEPTMDPREAHSRRISWSKAVEQARHQPTTTAGKQVQTDQISERGSHTPRVLAPPALP